MTNRDAFIRAVIECPDDDAPRLIMADWLEERGDSDRGEFIRVQCALALGQTGSVRQHLIRRLRSLQRKEEDWLREEGIHADLSGFNFHRGFLERVRMYAAAFLASAPAVFALEPVRELHLIVASRDPDHRAKLMNEFTDCLLLKRLKRLSLWLPELDEAVAVGLAGCEHICGLSSLRISAGTVLDIAERIIRRNFGRRLRIPSGVSRIPG